MENERQDRLLNEFLSVVERVLNAEERMQNKDVVAELLEIVEEEYDL